MNLSRNESSSSTVPLNAALVYSHRIATNGP